MGHDVYNVRRHNLNTSSIEGLAEDLSKRLKANVEYGYYDTFFFDWDGFYREASYNLLKFGVIKFPGAHTTLRISDENYFYHIIYSKYGEDAFILNCLSNENERIELLDSIDSVKYELFECHEFNQKAIGKIFNDTFHDHYTCFNGRWSGFCIAFTEEDKNGYFIDQVIKFRHEIHNFYKIIGVTETFYFNDQGESAYLTYSYYNWSDLKNEVELFFRDATLHIPNFMKYRNLMPINLFPFVFYDDFSDFEK